MARYLQLGDLYTNQRLGSFEEQNTLNSFGNQLGNLGNLGNFGQADPSLLVPIESTFNFMQSIGLGSEISGLSSLRGAQIANFLFALPTGNGTYDLVRQSNQDMFMRGISGRGEEVSSANKVVFCPPRTRCGGGGGGASAPKDQGTSAGEVLTGIAAILAPLAQAGVGIYGASQQAALAKQRLKAGGGSGGGGSDAALIAAFSRGQQGGSNTGIIVAVIMVVIIMGMMMFMMNKKK